jgi:uncharacterized membrane protein required for colicin V production
MSTTFNTLDLIFFAFTAIFVITATFRGFVKEVFSLFNWITSLILSYLLAPYLTEFLSKHFTNKLAIDLVSRSGLFAVIFIIIAMSTKNLRESLHERLPTIFNRSLGMLFGFAKTLIIFGAIYSIYQNAYGLVMKKDRVAEPEWLEASKCRSLIKVSAEIVDPAVRKFFDAIGQNFDQVLPKSEDLLNDKINEIMKDQPIGGEDGFSKDAPALSDEELERSLDTGYTKKNIEKLNQLMDVINK